MKKTLLSLAFLLLGICLFSQNPTLIVPSNVGRIFDLEFTPNQKQLLVASFGGMKVYDALKGKELQHIPLIIEGQAGGVKEIVILPSQKEALLFNDEGFAYYDIEKMKITEVVIRKNMGRAVLMPDGQKVLFFAKNFRSKNAILAYYDLKTKQYELDEAKLEDLASLEVLNISNDGKTLQYVGESNLPDIEIMEAFVAYYKGGAISKGFVSLPNLEKIENDFETFSFEKEKVNRRLGFSPNSKPLAIKSGGIVFELNGKKESSVPLSDIEFCQFATSPSQKLIAISNQYGFVILEANSLKVLDKLLYPAPIRAELCLPAFSRDDKLLAIGNTVFNIADKSKVFESSDAVFAKNFSTSLGGTSLLLEADPPIWISAEVSATHFNSLNPKNPVIQTSIAAKGNTGSYQTQNGIVLLQPQRTKVEESAPISTITPLGKVVFSNKGERFFVIGASKPSIYDRNGKEVASLKLPENTSSDKITLTCWSTDDKRIFTYYANAQICCFESNSGKLLWTFDTPKVLEMKVVERLEALVLTLDGQDVDKGVFTTRKRIKITDGSLIGANSYMDYGKFKVIPELQTIDPGFRQILTIDKNELTVRDAKNGQLKGNIPLLWGTGQKVYFIKDDIHAAVLLDNGNIGFYRTDTKTPLGRLIFGKNEKEWAVVAQDGRFDASPEMTKRLYFANGEQQIPLEALSEIFYAPNLLYQLLDTTTSSVVVAPTDINGLKKAPKIKIEHELKTRNLVVEDDNDTGIPVFNTDVANVTLSITATSEDDVISEIRLFQNGKLINIGTRNLVVENEITKQKALNYSVQLQPGDNVFKAIAINSQRTESKPDLVNIQYKAPVSAKAVSGRGPKLHLIVIGINEYKNPKYNLNYALADANSIKDAFQNGLKDILPEVKLHLITDANASKVGILNAFDAIIKDIQPIDLMIFYFAGHGVVTESDAQFYLVPHDVTQLYGDEASLVKLGLSTAELKDFSSKVSAQKQLFILDACQSSGAIANIVTQRGAAEEKALAQLARSTGTHWLAASGSEQFASEFAQLGHGVFTYTLLEALKGKASTNDKQITVNELKAYIEESVPELTEKYKGSPQYPSSFGFGNDFPVGTFK